MTEPAVLAKIIANGESAQAIHQNGHLVYANCAAANIFGFDNIRSFATFVEAMSLFAHERKQENTIVTRFLKLKRVNQTDKTIRIIDRHLEWNSAPLSKIAQAIPKSGKPNKDQLVKPLELNQV